MQHDLFAEPKEVLAEGAVLLRGYCDAGSEVLLRDLNGVSRGGVFRHMITQLRRSRRGERRRSYRYTLTPVVSDLRSALYPQMAPIASRSKGVGYPADDAEYLTAAIRGALTLLAS